MFKFDLQTLDGRHHYITAELLFFDKENNVVSFYTLVDSETKRLIALYPRENLYSVELVEDDKP